MRFYVAGLGAAGAAIAHALDAQGALAGAWTRTPARAETVRARLRVGIDVGPFPRPFPACDAIVIAVPDRVIASVAQALDATLDMAADTPSAQGPCLLHCSGALSLDVLPASLGERRGGAHPLMSLHGAEDAARLSGAFFAIEGTGAGAQAARALAAKVGGVAGSIDATQKVAYHAAAVLASNGVYALASAVRALLDDAGLGDTPALLSGMQNLTTESAAAAQSIPLRDAATGPVVRGDAATLRNHLHLLAERSEDTRNLYHAVQVQLLRVAEERGLDASLVGALHAVLFGDLDAAP